MRDVLERVGDADERVLDAEIGLVAGAEWVQDGVQRFGDGERLVAGGAVCITDGERSSVTLTGSVSQDNLAI